MENSNRNYFCCSVIRKQDEDCKEAFMPSYETDTTQDNNLRCIRPFADIPVTRSEIMKLHHESMMRNMVEFEPLVPVYQPVMSVPIKQDTDWSALNTRIAQKFRNVANVISSLKDEVKDSISSKSWNPFRDMKVPFRSSANAY